MDVNEKLRQLEEMVKADYEQNRQINSLKEPYGLVLSGGGGKGAYQIGVMKALIERGLIDNICGISGASIGAINLTLFAMKDLDTAIDAWSHISNSQFLDLDEKLIDFKEGLFSREGLLTLMDSYVNYETVSNFSKPLFVNATSYKTDDTKECVYFKLNGLSFTDIKTLLMASSALPIVYENINYNGLTLKDGGITDNTPIKPLYEAGIRNFLVVDLSHKAAIDQTSFKDSKFVHIKPYRSIGEMLNGTLDFSTKGAKLRMELGYVDAIRTLDSISGENSSSIEAMNIKADYEYNNIIAKYNVDKRIDEMNQYIDKINNI